MDELLQTTKRDNNYSKAELMRMKLNKQLNVITDALLSTYIYIHTILNSNVEIHSYNCIVHS